MSQLSQIYFRSAFTNYQNITSYNYLQAYLQNIQTHDIIKVIKNGMSGGLV